MSNISHSVVNLTTGEASNLTDQQLDKFPSEGTNTDESLNKNSFAYSSYQVKRAEQSQYNSQLIPRVKSGGLNQAKFLSYSSINKFSDQRNNLAFPNHTQKLSNFITVQQVTTPDSNNNPVKPAQPNNPPPTDAKPSDPPQLEGRPNDSPLPAPAPIEQRLEKPSENYPQRIERLLQILGTPTETQTEAEPGKNTELGVIIARQEAIEQQPLPQQPPTFRPIGYVSGHVSYFLTDNLFSSSVDPIQDGLIFSGLTLATAPIELSPKTYLSGSVDGNLVKYIDQSEFNYNQIQVNVNLYHQITSRMYGEVGWSNQQLFYARDSDRYDFSSGDRFLNENAWHLSLGRRDPLSKKLMFDSYYELRWSLTGPPEKRDRLINSLWLSLNYYLQKPLQVGLNYQFNLSSFTQRDRQDISHRIYSHLNYRLSDTNSMSAQAGVSLGNSTESSIDFDGWFFSINYNVDLGRF
ncbi:hypothetical protein [Calothrix sp. PCC 6303]|uniref:hypothetical protein n=1 Tax=Calothrix sp. PCC 6303 TaxID=1170562 RepID=UPI00130E7181|nr:hypothetical protein [Calothrix sp. PCC 6303]